MVKFIILTCLGYLANIYLALPLQASAVYYIDFNEGSDTAEGTSPSTAWKTIPGTYNLQRTDYQSRTWGSSSVSSSKKVPAGTTFRIKSGSVHNEINGSYIVIDSAFYATNADAASPISFVRDTNWGTGSIVFDGAAMNLNATNAEALIVVKTHGIVFNGVTRRGIIIQNSGVSGLRIKDVGAAPARDIILSNLYGYNNGTSILGDNLGAGVAHFHMKSVAGGQILSCEVDGNNQFVNGFLFGETHLSATNVMVTDCSAHRLKGDLSGNDSGIGFKAQNSQITFNDCTAYNNLKGLTWVKKAAMVLT